MRRRVTRRRWVQLSGAAAATGGLAGIPAAAGAAASSRAAGEAVAIRIVADRYATAMRRPAAAGTAGGARGEPVAIAA